MKKSERIGDLIASLPCNPGGMDPRYTAFFEFFNRALYYEAHEVLEDLWLHNREADRGFFKGLIQVAGGFVHLQKQRLRPGHPKDSGRLRPAFRLFQVAQGNLSSFGPSHLFLNVLGLCESLRRLCEEIEKGEFQRNPWNSEQAPRLSLEAHGEVLR